MSNGFFTTSKHRTGFANRFRMAIGFLSILLLLLASTIVWALQQKPVEISQASDHTQTMSNESERHESVLVASMRIEAGTKLNLSMFTEKQFNPEYMPVGLVTREHASALSGSYSSRMIPSGSPIAYSDFSENVPLESLPIPEGFRAVTINASQRELVEGFVKPNSRIDLLWHYKDQRGNQKVKTLMPFIKVLAVNGKTTADAARAEVGPGGATATLLVSIRDAQRLELAQSLGRISLALLGSSANGLSSKAGNEVGLGSLLDEDEMLEAEREGVLVLTDSRSGNIITYYLKNGRWIRDQEKNL